MTVGIGVVARVLRLRARAAEPMAEAAAAALYRAKAAGRSQWGMAIAR